MSVCQVCLATRWFFNKILTTLCGASQIPGEKVSIEASWGNLVTTIANAAGDWRVFLKTPSHGTGHSLIIRGKNTISLDNVAIGEVWLCVGQSNMGWSLGNCFDAESETARAKTPNLRIYQSSREHWHQPLKESRDLLAKWVPCTPETAAATSAVSYHFGKNSSRSTWHSRWNHCASLRWNPDRGLDSC